MTFEQVLAALVFVACVALLVHHFLGAQRQARLRWWWTARAARARQASNHLRLWHRSRQLRRAQKDARAAAEAMKGAAAREAADIIERARRRAQAREDGAEPGADEPGADGGNGGTPRDGAGGPRAPGGDNVVRPQRFGNRRNDLH